MREVVGSGVRCEFKQGENLVRDRTIFLIRFTTHAAIGVVPFFSNAEGTAGAAGPVDAKMADISLPLSASYFDFLDIAGFDFVN